MTKVSYIVKFKNQEQYIQNVINSLKNIKGDFRKEFIIIDEASTNKSSELIKEHSKELPNVLIISDNNNSQSLLINAISLAHGKYIQFVPGDHVVDKNSSLYLLDTLNKHNAKIALGTTGYFDFKNMQSSEQKKYDKEKFITNPITSLLKINPLKIKELCSSALMISKQIIDDLSILKNIYNNKKINNELSLVLIIAAKNGFVFSSKHISYAPLIRNRDEFINMKKSCTVEFLLAIKDFIKHEKQYAKMYKKEIYRAVIAFLWTIEQNKLLFLPTYLWSKIFAPKIIKVEDISDLIDAKLEIFSKNFNLST